MNPPSGMRVRYAARVLLLDPLDRTLLFQIEDDSFADPAAPLRGAFWITPGGGLEAGERFEEAALRELWEETGLRGLALGPCVAHRETDARLSGERLHISERYYLVRAPAEAAISLENFTPLEHEVYRAHRWWPADELATTSERVFPRALASLVADVLAGRTFEAPRMID